jgi:hypothetical protein
MKHVLKTSTNNSDGIFNKAKKRKVVDEVFVRTNEKL